MTDTNADAGIALRDSANLDAFARLRVSQPANLFDSKLTYNLALDHARSNPIALSIVCTGIGGTSSVAGALTWTEVR